MATLSLSMIVLNVEEYIENCLNSVVPHVNEIVIVDTGSTDRSKETILRLCPQAKIFDFNHRTHPHAFTLDAPESWPSDVIPGPFSQRPFLSDFAAARQFGLEKCTSDYVLWLDSDDVLEHGEKLPQIVSEMERNNEDALLFGYDYSHDGRGNSTCRLFRERIVKRSSNPQWRQPVHEVINPIGRARVTEDLNVRHRRQEIRTQTNVHHRNLKILLKWWHEHKNDTENLDPRMLFYLGMEERFLWPDKAIETFKLYCSKSGWDEERALAHMLSGHLHEQKGRLPEAITSYAQASLEAFWNPDPLFGAARIAYFKKDWAKCIEWTERGFEIHEKEQKRKSVLMVDPLDRTYRPYIYYSVALMETGNYEKALQACQSGLKVNPNDVHLRGNLDVCQRHLEQSKPIDMRIAFNRDEPLDSPSLNVPSDVLAAFAIQMWKKNLEAGKPEKALQLLNSIPEEIAQHPKVKNATTFTMSNRECSVFLPVQN